MQFEAIPAAPLFLLPDLRRYSAWKGIDRLQVIVSTSRGQPSASDWTQEMALTKLSEAGLSCRHIAGDRVRILGGLSSVVTHGMTVYECPFAINQDPDGRFATTVVGARGFHDEALVLPTLEGAVDRIIGVYQRRGMLRGAQRSPTQIRRQ